MVYLRGRPRDRWYLHRLGHITKTDGVSLHLLLRILEGPSLQCKKPFFILKLNTKQTFVRIWVSIWATSSRFHQPCWSNWPFLLWTVMFQTFLLHHCRLCREHWGMTVTKARHGKHQFTLDLCGNHLRVRVTVSAAELTAVFAPHLSHHSKCVSSRF